MARYVLSPAAQNSLRQIKAYSEQQFGLQQTQLYLKNLQLAFRALADNPVRGISRDELFSGCYSHFVGSHTIYYRIQPELIEVIDVLHQSMEPQKHL